MIFAFARDGGLPASSFFAKVHPQLGLPLNALFLTSFVVVIFGVINIASTKYILYPTFPTFIRQTNIPYPSRSAFSAIISAAVVTLDLSYGMPIAVNCFQGRKALPERDWQLPSWLGWISDLVGLSYIILTTVLFIFPPELPVSGGNMSTFCVYRKPRVILLY